MVISKGGTKKKEMSGSTPTYVASMSSDIKTRLLATASETQQFFDPTQQVMDSKAQPYGHANTRSVEDNTDEDDDISRMTYNNNVFDDHISFTTHENLNSVARQK